MGKSVEKTGKTVSDAIAAALNELELTIDDVRVEVLNEGKTGLFGLLSGKPAKVRVSELDGGAQNTAPVKAVPGGDAEEDREEGEDGGADGYETDGADGGWPDTDAESDGYGGQNGYGGREPFEGNGAGDITLDSEMDRAMEYLEEIFKGIDISAEMDAERTDDGFIINVVSEDSGILIGHRGETLDAIQYLVNLYLNKGRNNYIRVSVDIENYKRKREAALIKIAGQTADKVVRLRRNFTLDPMNSYERRIVHSALQNHPRVETYSVGDEPNRKVVVTLKNRGGYQPR